MGKNLIFLKKIYYFFLSILLLSCSNELYEDYNYKNNIIAKKISMNDLHFKQNAKLVNRVNTLKTNQNNQTGRYEYNSELDFYIDEENGISLKIDSLESYTFPVYKTELDSTVTNIVFNKTSTGDYDIILAKYDILEEDLPILTQTEINQSNVEFTDLSGRQAAPELICVDIQEYQPIPIHQGDLIGYNGSTGQWVTIGSYCTWGSSTTGGNADTTGGSTTSAGGSTTPTGGGSSSGTSTGDVITTPIRNHGRDLPEYVDAETIAANKPCPGDPIKNPTICPSSPGNIKGGSYGCTRNDSSKKCNNIPGKKKHGGVDIKMNPTNLIYSMHAGIVIDKKDIYTPSQYVKNSFGNYIEIQSVINGATVRIKYCHLASVEVPLNGNIAQGQWIAVSGKSGNAAAKGVTPHLHIQAKMLINNSWVEIDPIDLFNTIYDVNTLQPIGSKTNCQ